MSYFAVFIDAGHLIAWGADRRIGARAPRTAIQCDHRQLIQALIGHCCGHSNRELLRIYWYDGAPNHVPTPEQEAIGRMESVKLRLGRLTQSGQKGVDTLMVLDLTAMARERAIDAAFLLTGDEDLREAVLVAQQLGVRVVLLNLAPTPAGQGRQAESLVREADACSDITSVVDPFFTHMQTAAFQAGFAYGQVWVGQANASDVQRMRSLAPEVTPVLPPSIPLLLRGAVRQALHTGALQGWQDREAERGFLNALGQGTPTTSVLPIGAGP